MLPAVVYFALTAQQSLELDPFNHVVECLMTPGYAAGAREIDASQAPLRVFSVTLPYHTENMADNEAAFGKWAQVYSEGGDVVGGFVRRASDALDALVEQGVIDENSVFTAGLSRGGLMAGHLAARNRRVKGLLGFAPVTVLSDLPEFSDNVVQDAGARVKIARASLLSDEVIERLVFLPVRFYMGNVDRRVGTRNAFELTHLLAEHGVLKEGMRSPPHEFIMYCSVGKHGHGTPRFVKIPYCFQFLFRGLLLILTGLREFPVSCSAVSCFGTVTSFRMGRDGS